MPLKEGTSCRSSLTSLPLGSGEGCTTNTNPKPFRTFSRALWGSEEPLGLGCLRTLKVLQEEGSPSLPGLGPTLDPSTLFSSLLPSPKAQSQPLPQHSSTLALKCPACPAPPLLPQRRDVRSGFNPQRFIRSLPSIRPQAGHW